MSAVACSWLGRQDYATALEKQQDLVALVASGKSGEQLLLLEHDPVFTIGRTRDLSSLRRADELPYPVVETNRGGQATYHGPGQLVGYPILHLGRRGRDLHAYLRFLEGFLITVCSHWGIAACRREGLTGVWVEDRKIASIGVGLRQWVSMHGFALNVGSDLAAFSCITPCGISGVVMTSISRECGRELVPQEVAELCAETFSGALENGLPEKSGGARH
ncbi:MAG: lipoyl(octanoyl) transferase LipB [Terrimicrobiaceae bacterium]